MQATSKLRSPLPSPDRPLLRMRGRYLSDYAAMPTMNIQYFFRYSRYQMCAKLQQIRSERDTELVGILMANHVCQEFLSAILQTSSYL